MDHFILMKYESCILYHTIIYHKDYKEFYKFKKDASNGLSFSAMKDHVDKNHPRILGISKKSKNQISNILIRWCS